MSGAVGVTQWEWDRPPSPVFFFGLNIKINNATHTTRGYEKFYYSHSGESRESSQAGLKMAWESQERRPAWCFWCWGVRLGWIPGAGAPWFEPPASYKGVSELSISFAQMCGRKGRGSGKAWKLCAIEHQEKNQIHRYKGQMAGRQKKSNRRLCYSLGPVLLIGEEDSSPSEFLGTCGPSQSRSCERLRKRKRRKKKDGEFSPFSLNVRRPLSHFSCQN